jgi:hypothetical protein
MEARMNHLIAVYETLAEAERVCDRLKNDIKPRDVRLIRAPLARDRDPLLERGALRDDLNTRGDFDADEDYLHDWLRRSAMPQSERDAIVAHMIGTRAAVMVDLEDDDDSRDRAVEIMEEGHPIDVEHDTLDVAAGATSAAVPPVFPPVNPPSTEMPPSSAARTDARAGRVSEDEQVIPVVKEDIAVGKRVRENRFRVRTYTVERPVEEDVMLRDERVEIEHRPITGAAAARASELPKDREVEVVERHEEPVVEKRGSTAEEVVIRKEVRERPETVRGTVRETKVDVEKEPAAAGTRVERDLEEGRAIDERLPGGPNRRP